MIPKARFIRRISAVSNAIETIDNEIVYCLNCIRHGRNATFERGLSLELSCIFLKLASNHSDSAILF